MSMHTYPYSVQGDTKKGYADLRRLESEIRDSPDISIALGSVSSSGDSLLITFKAPLASPEETALGLLLGAHEGDPFPEPFAPDGTPYTILKGTSEVAIVPSSGSRNNFITHNFADRSSWAQDSLRVAGDVLTDMGTNGPSGVAGHDWKMAHNTIVRLTRGHVFAEHKQLDAQGNSYAVSVTVDGAPVTEKDKHSGAGDYSVSYTQGIVSFDSAQAGPVQATYHKVNSSLFVIAPDPGKKIEIVEVEVQFSEDYDIRDTVVFQPMGLVDVFAPHLMPAVPSGTKIPLGAPTKYNTSHDYVRESNGSFPRIHTSTNPSAVGNWRMAQSGTQGYPWKYKTKSDLRSAYGMEMHVCLEHDTEFGGEEATATFYCLSHDDE